MTSSLNTELLCSISSNGDCVALCTPDGVIKFYDTLTSNLKLEYASSTHLQASCTCLSWSKVKRKTQPVVNAKQKKIKTENHDSQATIENELNDLDLIAIGTSEGSILLFSLTKAALHSQLSDGGHSDKVNDVCWCPNYSDSIYSCSDDGYIVEWSFVESKIKSKWKASKTAITSIALDPTSRYLICSSKTITVWDLSTKTKIKTLTGHSNDIFKLTFLNNKNKDSNYFVSAANNDRIINSWAFDASSDSNNTALASFSLNDGPVFIDLVCANKDGVLLSAVTSKGTLNIYNHNLSNGPNGKLKKPIKASNQVNIETHQGAPLKIFGSFLVNSNNERLDKIEVKEENNDISSALTNSTEYFLYIVYGSNLNPKIEKIKFSELNENKVTLKRDDPFITNVSLQSQSIKIETPSVSKDLKVLVPGFTAQPQTNNNLNLSNSKRKSVEPSQLSLEERLNIMGIDSNQDAKNSEIYAKNGQVPKTDNLLVLLVQGLQSNDAKMLNHVLQHKNEKVVAKTIRMLPTNYIVSLIKELNKRLQGHAQSGLGIIKWLKCVLMIHTSFLMSYPDLIESLGSVYEMMNARTKLFPQLSKLQGKLQLVMSQVSSQAEALQSANDKDVQPLLYYQDSTSEDEQIEDELIPSHSEFDEYVFSDEEVDEDENEEMDEDQDDDDDEEDDDEDAEDDDDSEEEMEDTIKKEKKKGKEETDEEDDDDDDDD